MHISPREPGRTPAVKHATTEPREACAGLRQDAVRRLAELSSISLTPRGGRIGTGAFSWRIGMRPAELAHARGDSEGFLLHLTIAFDFGDFNERNRRRSPVNMGNPKLPQLHLV